MNENFEVVAETYSYVIEYCLSTDIYYERMKSETTRQVASLIALQCAVWYNEAEKQSAIS